MHSVTLLSAGCVVGFCASKLFHSRGSKDADDADDAGDDNEAHGKHPAGGVTMYIGTYTQKMGHVHGKANGMHMASIDLLTGTMHARAHAQLDSVPNPTYIARHHDHLYVAHETADAQVSAWKITAGEQGRYPRLTLLNRQATGGADACHVSVVGGYLIVSNYSGSSMTTIPIADDGSLRNRVHTQQIRTHRHDTEPAYHTDGSTETGPHGRQECSHPHSAWAHPAFPSVPVVYVCDLGTDRIWTYLLKTGGTPRGTTTPQPARLTRHDSVAVGEPGAGVRHMALDPCGKYAYALCELGNTVVCLSIGKQGKLATRENTFDLPAVRSTLPADYHAEREESWSSHIVLSPCARFLYTANRGHDSICCFPVCPRTGLLGAPSWTPTLGRYPRHFAIHPTAGLLVVANQDSHSLVSFFIDQNTGQLKPTGHIVSMPSPVCVRL